MRRSLVGLEAGLWLWVGVAGVLFGSGWPGLAPGALPHAIVGRRRSSLRPSTGVPGRTAGRVARPHRVLPNARAALSLAARGRGRVGALASPTRSRERLGRPQAPWRSLGPGRRPGSPASHPSGSRAGSAFALGRVDVGDAIGRGLSLGYRGARLLRAEDRHALVVFGPTQSGKSAGVAIPNILEWAGPAIVVSIKPDLLDATITARADRGEVLVFDPFDLWTRPIHTWSPLASRAQLERRA